MVRAMHDVLYAAIIAAAAAIVGGIIGGAIPGYFMLKAEDKRYAHAMELERRAVIGTARALSEFFARVDTLYAVALETGQWWGDELDRKVQPLSLADQKAVYGQLTSDDAEVIASSMRQIVFMRARREAAGSEKLSTADIAKLESGRQVARNAAEHMLGVAKLRAPSTTTES
jgi:hypothetical protein